MLYVADVDEKSVIIGNAVEPWLSRDLKKPRPNELPITITASKDSSDYLHVEYNSEQELADIFAALRDAGLPFLDGGSGWTATAVFVLLRDKRLVSGEIETVGWTGPGKPIFHRL